LKQLVERFEGSSDEIVCRKLDPVRSRTNVNDLGVSEFDFSGQQRRNCARFLLCRDVQKVDCMWRVLSDNSMFSCEISLFVDFNGCAGRVKQPKIILQ
jgi:hypothetical protein